MSASERANSLFERLQKKHCVRPHVPLLPEVLDHFYLLTHTCCIWRKPFNTVKLQEMVNLHGRAICRGQEGETLNLMFLCWHRHSNKNTHTGVNRCRGNVHLVRNINFKSVYMPTPRRNHPTAKLALAWAFSPEATELSSVAAVVSGTSIAVEECAASLCDTACTHNGRSILHIPGLPHAEHSRCSSGSESYGMLCPLRSWSRGMTRLRSSLGTEIAQDYYDDAV